MSGSIIKIQVVKLIAGILRLSKKPKKMRFGGLEMGVVIPLMLAAKAIASKKRVRKNGSLERLIATGSKSKATVEFESAEPKITQAKPSAAIAPCGFLGNLLKKVLAISL